MTARTIVALLGAVCFLPGAVLAAQDDDARHDAGAHAHDAGDSTAHSPYAGMATVEGTTMTAEEVDGLRAGQGMRLALPAELNGFPGPLHVLELADRLEISDEVRAEVETIRGEMLAAAQRQGAAVIAADRALATAFRAASGGSRDAPSEVEIARLSAALGEARGQLQAIHLAAHLRTRALLTPEQRRRYEHLRGY
ncbi:MAG TPA: Spy/CpxP family protein refolding chaperone [Longimicrobiales bacterium]|nr:Spy/CpxP family protein refolding chaperone [Longimicrobiales bacterium]